MKLLIDQAAALEAAGATVHFITTQPLGFVSGHSGPNAHIAALLEKGVPPMPPTWKLTCDPELTLVAPDAPDTNVTRLHKEGWLMVQPAMAVLDTSTGKALPELTWSWKTMGYTASDDAKSVPQPSGSAGSILAIRPDPTDLCAAIKERRPARLVDFTGTLGWR